MRIFSLSLATLALLAAAPALAGDAGPDVIELTFDAQGFHPDKVEVPAGQLLRFKVRNAAAEPFNFEIEELNLSRQIRPGDVKMAYTLEAPPSGRYRFIAEFRGMDEDKSPGGTLEVQ